MKSLVQQRQDVLLLLLGIASSFMLTWMISILGSYLDCITHLPDKGRMWYYWILPQPTLATRTIVWSLYIGHQLLNWCLIYYGQTRLTYSTRLSPVHYWLVISNMVFILLHFVHTHTVYDPLAQDLSILFVQEILSIVLVWVLLMQNQSRGLFWGKAAPFSSSLATFARKYHGYFISFTMIINFWYHPMEGTIQHLTGFFYKFIIMTQSVLIMTPVHRNKWWTIVIELGVGLHATIVALVSNHGIWDMFLLGHFLVFILTQMHGLPGISRLQKIIACAAFLVTTVIIYIIKGGFVISMIIRVPIVYYCGVFILASLLKIITYFAY